MKALTELLMAVGCTLAACKGGGTDLSFREMHEAAVVETNKGLSVEAATRQFRGATVEMDAIPNEIMSGICSDCVEMSFEDITFLARPHSDLDKLKFLLFVEGNAGRKVHIRGVIDGGAQGFVQRSPLLVQVTAIEAQP